METELTGALSRVQREIDVKRRRKLRAGITNGNVSEQLMLIRPTKRAEIDDDDDADGMFDEADFDSDNDSNDDADTGSLEGAIGSDPASCAVRARRRLSAEVDRSNNAGAAGNDDDENRFSPTDSEESGDADGGGDVPYRARRRGSGDSDESEVNMALLHAKASVMRRLSNAKQDRLKIALMTAKLQSAVKNTAMRATLGGGRDVSDGGEAVDDDDDAAVADAKLLHRPGPIALDGSVAAAAAAAAAAARGPGAPHEMLSLTPHRVENRGMPLFVVVCSRRREAQ